MSTLRLGSRGSQLALFQARLVAGRIRSAGGPAVEIVVIKTQGDRLQEAPLSDIGGKRLFVKEIEDALIDGTIDIAVHSSKDMSAVLPEGLAIGAVLEREDARDAIVGSTKIHKGRSTKAHEARNTKIDEERDGREEIMRLARDLPSGVRIGTGSVRRIAQLRALFPGASFHNVRGNVDTRLRKLDSGEFDLLVLAAAGLRRLGYASRISVPLPLADCVPAPGQGIIAIEVRAGDSDAMNAVVRVNDSDVSAALAAERALVTALGGGCQMPIGGIAIPVGSEHLELRALVSSLDGARVLRYNKTGMRNSAEALGREVAAHLLESGAAAILNEARAAGSADTNPEAVRLT